MRKLVIVLVVLLSIIFVGIPAAVLMFAGVFPSMIILMGYYGEVFFILGVCFMIFRKYLRVREGVNIPSIEEIKSSMREFVP